MSTGKRLAKRSILGTRVSILGLDSLYSPGIIQAVKTQEDGGIGGGMQMPTRYSVRFDDSRRTRECLEADIVGPGFKAVSEVQLASGQPVFVTHNQREMRGQVVRHDFDSQDVILKVNETETLLKKIEEIRLLESRKSARLVNSDTDFSKLADVNISGNNISGSADSKRRVVSRGSGAIAVPARSDYVQIAGSRKRRTSENIGDDEEVMTECSAAMLLMKLSCSPHALTSPTSHSGNDRPPSVDSSSGASSFRSSTPSPPLSSSAATDEGIVKDINDRSLRIIYQCTYPGCKDQRASVRGIEAHVRKEHLLKDDPDLLLEEGEEEFYYTEIEDDRSRNQSLSSPRQLLLQQNNMAATTQWSQNDPSLFSIRARSYSSSDSSSSAKQLASLSLVDHLDMARPAHEDPCRGAVTQRSILVPSSTSSLLAVRSSKESTITMPITIAPSANGSPGKYILISPPSQRNDLNGGSAMSAPSPIAAFPSSVQNTSPGSNLLKSPARRVREGKKCRKVYGLEQRDLWCTQCKWKKACARFGSGGGNAQHPATHSPATTGAVASPPYGNVLSTSSPAGSLLMTAASAGSSPNRQTAFPSNIIMAGPNNAARAIKF